MQKDLKLKKTYKVAIVAPTPFHYHVPLYRQLSEMTEIELMVYYCSDETLRGADIEKMYCIKDKMVDPENMLGGYNYKFLKNFSLKPSYMRWPFGLINLGVWREIRKNKYNVVIIQSWTNFTWWLIAFACLIFKTPYMFMTDANELGTEFKGGLKRKVKKLLLGKILFKYASGFLTSGIANEYFYWNYGVLYQKMKRMPFSWGYNDILGYAEKIKEDRIKMRNEFGVSDNDFVFLYVGRQSKEKLPLNLIDAYNKVEAKNKKLFFVGDGPMAKEIKEYVSSKNIKNVEFFGFQKRPYLFTFYNIADVLILPSDNEPWGIVVNEAMCFGLPIIASDRVGASLDLVETNYNGFVFKAGDVDKLTIYMQKILDMVPEKRKLFGDRSKTIIISWIKKIDPKQKILKILQLLQ